jgi:hypothetical protein
MVSEPLGRPRGELRAEGCLVPQVSDDFDLTALRDENRQLRELVIQLSKIVVRNAMERK